MILPLNELLGMTRVGSSGVLLGGHEYRRGNQSSGHGRLLAGSSMIGLSQIPRIEPSQAAKNRSIQCPMPSRTIALYKPYDVLCQFTRRGGPGHAQEFVPIPGSIRSAGSTATARACSS